MYQLHRYREAIQAIDAAMPAITDPQMRANGHYILGESYRALNEFVNARNQYQTILTTYGRTSLAPHALYSMGWTYVDERNLAQAAETFALVKERYPGLRSSPRLSSGAAWRSKSWATRRNRSGFSPNW